MIGFEPFMKKVRPRVPGAAQPAIKDAIRVAAQEFCMRTRLWREKDKFEIKDTDLGVAAVPDDASIFEIESSYLNGQMIEPVSISWLDETQPRWRERTADIAQWLTQTEPDTVRLVPLASGTLELHLIVKPSEDAEFFPDWMANHYLQVIADGALAELFAMPNEEYMNPELAVFHSERFNRRLDGMSASNLKGQQKARVRTKPFFF